MTLSPHAKLQPKRFTLRAPAGLSAACTSMFRALGRPAVEPRGPRGPGIRNRSRGNSAIRRLVALKKERFLAERAFLWAHLCRFGQTCRYWQSAEGAVAMTIGGATRTGLSLRAISRGHSPV
jgi:hypothetical protein